VLCAFCIIFAGERRATTLPFDVGTGCNNASARSPVCLLRRDFSPPLTFASTLNFCFFAPLRSLQIGIFLFVEVIPICVGVREGVLNHFSQKDVGDHSGSARYQTLPQDPQSLVLDTQHNVVRTVLVYPACLEGTPYLDE
jgi:hypothetical protein